MANRFYLFFVLFSMLSFNLRAEQAAPELELERANVVTLTKGIPTKYLMADVFKNFTKLLPYMTSEMKFRDPSNDKKIKELLFNLKTSFSLAHQNKTLKGPSFSASLASIVQHLDETSNSFMGDHKIFAYNRVRATTSLCISCHSQISTSKRVFLSGALNKLKRSDFLNDHDYGDYLYLLRQNNKALKYFKLDIETILKSTETIPFNVARFEKSLKKIMVINTLTLGTPERTQGLLEDLLRRKNVPPFLKDEMKLWKKQLGNLSKNVHLKNSVKTAKDVDKLIAVYLEKKLKDEEALNSGNIDLGLLKAVGMLSRFSQGKKMTQKAPQLLYWMSMSERQLNRNYLFDLADVYLKQCVEKYPQSGYAKRCLKEYENNLVFNFTGSKGTDIPDYEKKELARLKKLIK
jgi:hypothetical protein